MYSLTTVKPTMVHFPASSSSSCLFVIILLQSVLIAWLVWKCNLLSFSEVLSPKKTIGQVSESNFQSPSSPTEPSDNTKVKAVSDLTSSVICNGRDKSERVCRFENLCFFNALDEFVFIHGPDSQYVGLPEVLNDPPFLDLSSVSNHSDKYFHFSTVSHAQVTSLNPSSFSFIYGESLILHRFNPENLMHVIHDDLLPIFHTKRMLYPRSTRDQVKLIFMDDRFPGPFYDLYQLLAEKVYMRSNITVNDFTCFESASIGLLKGTVWYQYGFQIPQGPVHRPSFPSLELRYFSEYVLRKLQQSSTSSSQFQIESPYVVLFSRSQTRLILNEAQLILHVTTMLKMPVYSVDIEHDSFSDILQLVSKASVLIGVHGAHLSTGIFMSNQARVLVEIFPYGILPADYTPYRTMSKLRKIEYFSWENNDAENTFPHPERSPTTGGIHHLSKDIQLEIQRQRYVSKHLCCKDPSWLYRAYQDTIVDLNSFNGVLLKVQTYITDQSVGSSDNKCEQFRTQKMFYPAQPCGLHCAVEQSKNSKESIDSAHAREPGRLVNVTWEKPWNVTPFMVKELSYEVKFQFQSSSNFQDRSEKHQSVLTEFLVLEVPRPIAEVHVWVRCVICGECRGPYSNAMICKLE